jgi:hypothetical protein
LRKSTIQTSRETRACFLPICPKQNYKADSVPSVAHMSVLFVAAEQGLLRRWQTQVNPRDALLTKWRSTWNHAPGPGRSRTNRNPAVSAPSCLFVCAERSLHFFTLSPSGYASWPPCHRRWSTLRLIISLSLCVEERSRVTKLFIYFPSGNKIFHLIIMAHIIY